jgi:hypothetical protein
VRHDQDSEFSPFRDFSLGFHERREQPEYGIEMIMIRWVCPHDGSSWGLSWNPGTTVFDNSTVVQMRWTVFTFQSLLLECVGLVSWRSGLLGS